MNELKKMERKWIKNLNSLLKYNDIDCKATKTENANMAEKEQTKRMVDVITKSYRDQLDSEKIDNKIEEFGKNNDLSTEDIQSLKKEIKVQINYENLMVDIINIIEKTGTSGSSPQILPENFSERDRKILEFYDYIESLWSKNSNWNINITEYDTGVVIIKFETPKNEKNDSGDGNGKSGKNNKK